MDSRIELLRSSSGPAFTYGLSSESIESFLISDPNLDLAIDQAVLARGQMDSSIEELLLNLDEADFAKELQKYYVNFY
jgi:hypothetical protein